MKAFVSISMAIFSSTTLIHLLQQCTVFLRKAEPVAMKQVALSALVKLSEITEALGVKDPPFLRYGLLIRPGLGNKVIFQVLTNGVFKKAGGRIRMGYK